MSYDFEYERYLADVLKNGVVKGDRTGTGTLSVFGRMMRFDLRKGFPLITTKKVFTKGIIHELLWFLKGSSNIKYLQDNNVHIWDEWADAQGELGPVYGVQWRSWPTGRWVKNNDLDARHDPPEWVEDSIDQIANVIELIKKSPDGRRHIVSAWNPAQVDQMKLPPCHVLFQFWTREFVMGERESLATSGGYTDGPLEYHQERESEYLDHLGVPKRAISCMLMQRSCDSFLGVPFNIASYALLTEMVAQQCDMIAEEFIWVGGDCHIYSNHVDQVNEQLSRTETAYYPKLRLNKAASIFDYTYEDVEIVGYNPLGKIEAPIAV